MEPQNDTPDGGATCVPEWVALNHLYSYCAKAMPARVATGDAPSRGKSEQCCTRKACLFSVARK